jgi:hypothetical protein
MITVIAFIGFVLLKRQRQNTELLDDTEQSEKKSTVIEEKGEKSVFQTGKTV